MDVEVNYQCPINGHQLATLNLGEVLIEKGIVLDPVVYSVKAVTKDGEELDSYFDPNNHHVLLLRALKTVSALCKFKEQSDKASNTSRDWKKFRQFLQEIEAID